jgi:hypothetical protein
VTHLSIVVFSLGWLFCDFWHLLGLVCFFLSQPRENNQNKCAHFKCLEKMYKMGVQKGCPKWVSKNVCPKMGVQNWCPKWVSKFGVPKDQKKPQKKVQKKPQKKVQKKVQKNVQKNVRKKV